MLMFAEFERSMIQARVDAGIARARNRGTRSGRPICRPSIPPEKETAIRDHLNAGIGLLKTAKLVGGSGTVRRIQKEMRAAA